VVDRTLILRKFSEADEYISQLREYGGTTEEQYRADWRVQRIVERTLQMIVETCADIANHIISDRGFRVPSGYADTFRVLYEEKILGEDVYRVMERMAKFRNIIVHHYDGVDASIVVNILREHLGDFETFKRTIIEYLR